MATQKPDPNSILQGILEEAMEDRFERMDALAEAMNFIAEKEHVFGFYVLLSVGGRSHTAGLNFNLDPHSRWKLGHRLMEEGLALLREQVRIEQRKK